MEVLASANNGLTDASTFFDGGLRIAFALL
jgi:hypothetical protein